MKRKIIIFLCLLITINAYSQQKLSNKEKKLINLTLDMRFSLRTINSTPSAINIINEFKKSIKNTEEWKNSSEEIKLCCENMIEVSMYNCLYDIDPKHPELEKTIMNQYNKVLKWNENHTENNPWYTLTASDVINSSMQFLPQAQAIKLGLKEKEAYDNLIEENPNMSFGLINIGLWYYFAPAIGGGSEKKAGEFFKRAVENSASDYESFYSLIYYSQYLYENKDLDGCNLLLKKAGELSNNCSYITFINKLNEQGYSLLYYTTNREKVDRKLGLGK